ncbi:MAG: tRNA pseudouridine(55) synthase TruB [bacterium]
MTNFGFLLIDKPAGITSHDVVDKLRRITGIKKIGHAGTLDPFATGLLIVAIGRDATKEISKFVGMDKEYVAEIVIGASTETLDSESEVSRVSRVAKVAKDAKDDVEKAMKSLVGTYGQIPPMYAAIKVKGKKLYELARQGKEIEREPREVTISAFELIDGIKHEDDLIIANARIKCSSGTYIRALARDLGEKLGTKAYLRNLRRTSIGEYKVADAHQLDQIKPADYWLLYTEHQVDDSQTS